MSELEIFCRNFTYLREISGLSIKEMALILDISVYSIKKIERGIVPKSIGVKTLDAIEDKFGIEPKYMFIDSKKLIRNNYKFSNEKESGRLAQKWHLNL